MLQIGNLKNFRKTFKIYLQSKSIFNKIIGKFRLTLRSISLFLQFLKSTNVFTRFVPSFFDHETVRNRRMHCKWTLFYLSLVKYSINLLFSLFLNTFSSSMRSKTWVRWILNGEFFGPQVRLKSSVLDVRKTKESF